MKLQSNDLEVVVPMGIVGRTYVVDLYILLYSDNISCEPYGFRDLQVIEFLSLWELLISEAWPVWIPGA